jgi:hypothetical protein
MVGCWAFCKYLDGTHEGIIPLPPNLPGHPLNETYYPVPGRYAVILRVDEKHAVRSIAVCFSLLLQGCSSTLLIYPKHGNHYGHAYYGVELIATH